MTRLVLGYDSACGTCVETAQKIETTAGGALEILPLNNEEMRGWRNEAFGDDPPFVPTLVEAGLQGTRVWSGKRIALELLRRVGPRKMWSISTALGRLRKPTGNDGPSRSAFVKGVLGAAAGVAVLSGGAAPALGSSRRPDHWLAKANIVNSEELDTRSARGAFAALSDAADGGGPEKRTQRSTLAAGVSLEGKTAKSVLHKLSDDSEIRAISIQDETTVIFTYELLKDGNIISIYSRSFEAMDTKGTGEFDKMRLLAIESDGKLQSVEPAASGCTNCNGRCQTCECQAYDLPCVARCCGPCAFACSSLWGCIGCVGIWCPLCINWADPCCTSSYCGWSQAPSCN